jgi:hypothetical protein
VSDSSRSFSPLLGIAAAALGVSLISYLLLSGRRLALPDFFRRNSLALYAGSGSAVGTFREVAEASGASTVLPVRSKQDVQNALSEHRNLSRLILAGHGTPTNFFQGVMTLSPQLLASWLAPALASGAVIGFAGCRSAADPGEADWGSTSYGPGGARSYIGVLRDSLYRLGAPRNIELRGHSTTGHAGGNPAGRSFRVQAYGQPGNSVIDLLYGQDAWRREDLRSAWSRAFQGNAATAWISGEDLRSLV